MSFWEAFSDPCRNFVRLADDINKEISELKDQSEGYSNLGSRERVRGSFDRKRKADQAEEAAILLQSKRNRRELENDVHEFTMAVNSLVHSRDRLLRLCELRRRQVCDLETCFESFVDGTRTS